MKSPRKNKFIETISNLRKKIVDLECENKKLKQELVAAETIMTKDKQNCLPKTSKDIQTNLKMMKKIHKKRIYYQPRQLCLFSHHLPMLRKRGNSNADVCVIEN